MKFLNFLLFPFKLIFYILHIIYLDFLRTFKYRYIPILEHIGLYKEFWEKTKNIDSWYKEVKDYSIKSLTRKPEDNPFRINCDTFVHKRFLWWYID